MRIGVVLLLAACSRSGPPPASPEPRCAQDEHIVPRAPAAVPEPDSIPLEGSEERGFEVAQDAFDRREYAEAIGRFKGLYEHNPRPQYLYNIARSFHLMDQCEGAQKFYELYLGTTPPEAQRVKVEGYLEALRGPCQARRPWPPPPARSC